MLTYYHLQRILSIKINVVSTWRQVKSVCYEQTPHYSRLLNDSLYPGDFFYGKYHWQDAVFFNNGSDMNLKYN